MNIRAKLTLRFILISAIIFLLSAVLIYILSADYRVDDFYSRLQNRANNTAKLLIEVDEVDTDLLQKIEQDNPISLPKEKIFIYNQQDSLIFSTNGSKTADTDVKFLEDVRRQRYVRSRQGEFEVLGFTFSGEDEQYVVIAAATDIYGSRRLQNLIVILLVVFAISIVIVSISGWIYAGRAMQPIAKVVDQVSEISITSLNRRVDEGNGKDEISRLAQTFNNMLARLQISFMTQKNFIANASHELRTPLTSITGQLEVTLLDDKNPADYRRVITSVLEDIRNLNILSNRLLLLAQSTTAERQRKVSYVRVDDLLWQVKEELLKHYPTYQISIDLDENLDDEKKLTIKGDEQLLKTALLNLIENGCKYSTTHSTNVYIESADTNLRLVFEDQGIGIPEAELPHVFEPFFRGSNTHSIHGHGIGLSMVKGIITMHGGHVNLNSVFGEGTTVVVTLPTLRSDGY